MKSIENRLDDLEAKSGQKGVVTSGCIAIAKMVSDIIGEPVDPQEIANQDRTAPISEEIKVAIQILLDDNTPCETQPEQFIPEALRAEAPAQASSSPTGSIPAVPGSNLHDEDFIGALANRIMRTCVSRIPGARSLTLQQADELERSIVAELNN